MGQQKLFDIAIEVVETWANAGRIPIPDETSRASLMPYAMDIAKQIQKGTLELEDIYKFIKEKFKDQGDLVRGKPYLWSLHSISRDIYAWKATREKSRIKYPAPMGWRNYTNQYGETLVWDYDTGHVIITPPAITEVDPIPNEFPSAKYRQIAPNEIIIKRSGRIGFERSFRLESNDLTEEELRSLEDIANNEQQ